MTYYGKLMMKIKDDLVLRSDILNNCLRLFYLKFTFCTYQSHLALVCNISESAFRTEIFIELLQL